MLIASIGLNVVLAATVAAIWQRGDTAAARPLGTLPSTNASTIDNDAQAGHGSGLPSQEISAASCAAALARCQNEELPRCIAKVATLGRRADAADARDLEKVFEGGEPNPALAERVRPFFSPQSTVECHDVVCQVDEIGDADELQSGDEKRMNDPHYRALESAARLSAGPAGKVKRLVRVAEGATLDGERVLDLWLHMRGPDAIVACGAEQAGENTVSASIDAEGRIALDAVRGSDKAACLQERLGATVPTREPIPTRPARMDRPLPNPFAPAAEPSPPRP